MNDGTDQECPDWKKWRTFFAERSCRLLPDPFADEPQLSSVPKSLRRSLAIFQLGESGGGTIIAQARKSGIAGIDDVYADAVALFVEEEHHHGELLACGVRMLGGELIRKNWTARLFVIGRRLMGFRFKVLVLLAAEVIGICYYHLLASRLPPSQLKNLLESMVADELAHLDFHCCFFRTQTTSRWRLTVFRIAWRTLTRVAAVAVLLDHRRALRDLHISAGTVWRRWMSVSRHAETLVSGVLPVVNPESSVVSSR